MHTMITSRSHIPPVSNKAVGSRGKGKVNISVLNSHNKLQIMLTTNKIFLNYSILVKKHGILAKSQHSQPSMKIMVWVIIYCP